MKSCKSSHVSSYAEEESELVSERHIKSKLFCDQMFCAIWADNTAPSSSCDKPSGLSLNVEIAYEL